MVELGITFVLNTDPENYPKDAKITWALTGNKAKLSTYPSTVTNSIWESEWSYDGSRSIPGRAWYTSPQLVKGMFDMMTSYKDLPWTHCTYLGMDETYNPCSMVGWGWISLNDFVLDGKETLPNGMILRALRTWYIETGKGTTTQFNTWWTDVKTNNSYRDSILLDWNFNEWLSKVYPAWDDHMHSMGKKSAHVGFINTDPDKANLSQLRWNWGNYLETFCQRCDATIVYHFPDTVESAQAGLSIAIYCRSLLRNKMVWLLSTWWEFNNPNAGSEPVQFEDYKTGLAGNADVIAMTVSADMGYGRPHTFIPNEPRILSFCQQTNTCPSVDPCPQPECGVTMEMR